MSFGTFMRMALVICSFALSCTSGDPVRAPTTSAPVAPAKTPRARLGGVKGTVTVKREAGDDWLSAGAGFELHENDKVRTAPGGSATLSFTNGSVVTIGEDALLSIAETRVNPGQERSDLTVIKGKVNAELGDSGQSSLTVSTPSAFVRAGREILFQ